MDIIINDDLTTPELHKHSELSVIYDTIHASITQPELNELSGACDIDLGEENFTDD